jgi:hypothetical protein
MQRRRPENSSFSPQGGEVMSIYYYLSMTPESLVASMLPPEEFGNYLAVGTKKSSHGQAMFFDLKEDQLGGVFDLSAVPARCVQHADGQPKHSLYLSVYRVLERMPLAAFNDLWLVTAKGQVLQRQASGGMPEFGDRFYLYQELCPVHPLVVSTLSPPEFLCFITDPHKAIYVPRICFVDLHLGDMATDPQNAQPRELFYPDHFYHLRECLLELKRDPEKHTKTVDRLHPQNFPYHFIRHGFFVGDRQRMLYYPFPTREELEGKYYYWWRRSAHH